MNIAIYIWVNKDYWNSTKIQAIKEAFPTISTKEDIKAAIGAGASGQLPELNLLVVIPGLIATGFLTAVGEDVWKLLKTGVKKITRIKPDRLDPNIPKQLNFPLASALIWWMHFRDKQFLITLNTTDEKEMDKALEKLPDFIDEALKEDNNIVRIAWYDNQWHF